LRLEVSPRPGWVCGGGERAQVQLVDRATRLQHHGGRGAQMRRASTKAAGFRGREAHGREFGGRPLVVGAQPRDTLLRATTRARFARDAEARKP
jgi:hypothetical protein